MPRRARRPPPPTTAPGSPATRTRILEAARSCIAQQHPAALSVEHIAQTAGVSHRTVYRYFPTKEALIEAVAMQPVVPELPPQMRWADAPGMLRASWHAFAHQLDQLRGERAIPGGIELRRARLASARRANERLLADAGVPRGPVRDGLLEIVVLLTSSTTFLELVDRHGHDVDTAVDLVVDAVQRLVASAQPRRTR